MQPRPCKNNSACKVLNTDIAKNGIVQKGAFKAEKGENVYYLEAETYPSKEWRAKTFTEYLKKQGINIKPYHTRVKNGKVIIATYSNYSAFSGQINFTEEQKKVLQKILNENKQNVLISYGSPFVDKDLEKLNCFLMAGSAGEEFEQTAAEILLGKLPAKGKMPF